MKQHEIDREEFNRKLDETLVKHRNDIDDMKRRDRNVYRKENTLKRENAFI